MLLFEFRICYVCIRCPTNVIQMSIFVAVNLCAQNKNLLTALEDEIGYLGFPSIFFFFSLLSVLYFLQGLPLIIAGNRHHLFATRILLLVLKVVSLVSPSIKGYTKPEAPRTAVVFLKKEAKAHTCMSTIRGWTYMAY